MTPARRRASAGRTPAPPCRARWLAARRPRIVADVEREHDAEHDDDDRDRASAIQRARVLHAADLFERSGAGSALGSGPARPAAADGAAPRRRGASARIVPSAITPPPIQSQRIIGLTRDPERHPAAAELGDDTSVR